MYAKYFRFWGPTGALPPGPSKTLPLRLVAESPTCLEFLTWKVGNPKVNVHKPIMRAFG